ARRRALEQRGLGTISGNRMRSSCRLMAKFALQQAPAVANLKRLFGTREGFDTKACLVDRFLGAEAALALADQREVDQHDAVLLHDANQQDDPDDADHVEGSFLP